MKSPVRTTYNLGLRKLEDKIEII